MPRKRAPLILSLLTRTATLATPVIKLLLNIRRMRGKEDPNRMGERFGYASLERPPGPLIWCHAASVGEMMSCLHLLKSLRTQRPELCVLVTTGTVTSAKLATQKLSEGMAHQFIPVDLPAAVERFLDHWQPDLVLWMESEFWPQLISRIGKRHIPLVLLNGRISERSAKSWRRYPHLRQTLFSCFTQLYAGSLRDAERFGSLGETRVQFVGNLKYDAPALAADTSTLSGLSSLFGQRPVWCAASTHPGEEAMIAEAHKEIAKAIPDLLTIIAPRHPHRGPEIAKKIESMQLTVARRSEGMGPSATTSIYLADTMGELGNLFRLCEVVFVGGSLVPNGGHNPIEPARLNCAILTGPHVYNFSDVYEDFAASNAAETVTDAASLARSVTALLGNYELRNERVAAAANVVSQRSGATRTIQKSLLQLLAPAEMAA